MTTIHPTAIVAEEAVIGEGCVIGPYCQIGPEAVLGARNTLYSNVVISGRSHIGDENRFFPYCVIGTDPQDLKYNGEPTGLRIGSRNTIREFVTVNRSNQAAEETILGDDNLLMEYVHVAHNCHIGNFCVIANTVQLAGHLVVGDHVSIGGLTAVHQFVHIGTHAFVGGASAIKKDIAPYTRGQGNPYKTVGLNSVGLMRKGFSTQAVAAIKQMYNLFYREGLNTSQALEKAEASGELTPEQQIFVEFIRQADRGLSR